MNGDFLFVILNEQRKKMCSDKWFFPIDWNVFGIIRVISHKMKYRSHIIHLRKATHVTVHFQNICRQKALIHVNLYLIECVRSKPYGKVTTGRATNHRRRRDRYLWKNKKMNYEYVYVYVEMKSKRENERKQANSRRESVFGWVGSVHFQKIREQSSKLDRVI